MHGIVKGQWELQKKYDGYPYMGKKNWKLNTFRIVGGDEMDKVRELEYVIGLIDERIRHGQEVLGQPYQGRLEEFKAKKFVELRAKCLELGIEVSKEVEKLETIKRVYSMSSDWWEIIKKKE